MHCEGGGCTEGWDLKCLEELPSQIRDNKGHCEMEKDETSEDVNWQVQAVLQHPKPERGTIPSAKTIGQPG